MYSFAGGAGAGFGAQDWLNNLSNLYTKDFNVWSDGRLANMQGAAKYSGASNLLHQMGIQARSQNLNIGSRVLDLLKNSYYYGDVAPGAGYSYQGDVNVKGGGKDGGYTKSMKAWRWDGNYTMPNAAPAPAAPTTPPTSAGTGGGGGGKGGAGAASTYTPEVPTMPDPPEFRYAPGGTGASVDAAATGFRRRKSSARTAGLTAKGTSQFKISGQTARSSGLNIGV